MHDLMTISSAETIRPRTLQVAPFEGQAPLRLDAEAISHIRRFLYDIQYEYVCMQHVPGAGQFLFPAFRDLQRAFVGLNPFYRLVLSLFRQGHAAEERHVRALLGGEILEAFRATGLLTVNAHGLLQTPGLLLASTEGLNLVVSVPPMYPTAAVKKQPVYVGPDSMWLTRAVGREQAGRSVLDICAGSGIQGLVCLARGARSVVALERHPIAVNIARFNAQLNGFADRVDVRQSDLYSALIPGERFETVVCNPPFMPVAQNVGYPICGDGGADGNELMTAIVGGMHEWLVEGGEAFIVSNCLGGAHTINFHQTLRREAEAHGWHITALVHHKQKIDDYLEKHLPETLKNACPEVPASERSRAVAAWHRGLLDMGIPASYLYSQLTRIRAVPAENQSSVTGLKIVPTYEPTATDVMVERITAAG